jgi:ubiquinone/menaquinone biosynthesis C-methylase UbiE
MDLSSSWEKADFKQQWVIASQEIQQLKAGRPPAVFASFISLMKNFIKDTTRLSFLDCACTSGYYLDVIQTALEHDIIYTGSDLAMSAVEMARARHPTVDWQVASVTALPFGTRSFDIVMASGLLEHVPDWRLGIDEITRVSSRYIILHRLPISQTGKFLNSEMVMYGVPTTRFAFAFHEIIDLLSDRGFAIITGLDTYHTYEVPEQTLLFKHRSFL